MEANKYRSTLETIQEKNNKKFDIINRPIFVFPVLLIVGSVLIILSQHFFARFIGIAIIILAIYSKVKNTDKIICSVYQDAIALFPNDTIPGFAILLPFNEIELWRFNSGPSRIDEFRIKMINGESFTLQSFSNTRLVAYFQKHLGDKQLKTEFKSKI